MNFQDYNTLGEIIDTSFGRSSTSGASTFSIKSTFAGENCIKVTYGCVVNITSDREILDLKRKYLEESEDIIEKYMAKVKKEFKEKTDKKITFKFMSNDSTFDIINLNTFNKNKTCHFKHIILYNIE